MSSTSKNYAGYKMDYIKDREVYKAVMFACRLIPEKGVHKAITIASNYYGVDRSIVNHYVSQRSGRKLNKKR